MDNVSASVIQSTLSPSLLGACERWGAGTALIARDGTWSYRELGERIRSLASAYRALGIAPGDRVLCQLPTCPEHVVALGAAWACGAIHVGVHPDLTAAELVDIVTRTEPSALLFAPGRSAQDPVDVFEAVRAAHPSLHTIVDRLDGAGDHRLSELLAREAPVPDASRKRASPELGSPELGSSELGSPELGFPERSGPDDPALLILTSGTTGTPKLVIETLPALWGKLALFAGAAEPRVDDVHLVFLPLCHIFGLKLTLMALASGGTVVLQERFSPQRALALGREHRVTILPSTPTHLTLLLAHLHREPDALASVRCIPFAAAPPAPSLIGQLYERLGARLMHVYGCSEGFVTLTTERDEIRRGACGRTVFAGPAGTPPTGDVEIHDPETGAARPPGEVGEIVFGTRRPVRYWDAPPAGVDGWYRTGDLGRRDADGCLTVCGRMRDVVNRGGIKVACAELEAAFSSHPAVADCAVIATPDPILGEAICACVVPAHERPPSLAEIRLCFSRSLAPHKLPDELCLLESLPRPKLGKLDRLALSAIVIAQDRPRERLLPRPRSASGKRPSAVGALDNPFLGPQ